MRPVRVFSTLSLCALLAAGQPAWAAPVVIDGVVASIEQEIIALSTLRAYRDEFAQNASYAVALQQLVDDRLLSTQARRYGLVMNPADLANELKLHPRPASFSVSEWEQVIGDRRLARRFLDFRFGDFVPITRDELRSYYDAHRANFPGAFAAEEERIRAVLLPAARARREDMYKEELRLIAGVRLHTELLKSD